MVLKQIKCPPEGNSNYGISQFNSKWLPSMERYAMDYIGLGEITGATSNKEADKVAIGNNTFIPQGVKCSNNSDTECIGQEKHMYLKNYPLGYIPTCIKNNDGTYTYGPKNKILGGTALMGGIQEDITHIPVTDAINSTMKKGPFYSNDCIKARLPVGSGLLMGSRKFDSKEEAEKSNLTQAWWIEEKCIPKQPTTSKEYGGEVFEIPFSDSLCIPEDSIEKFTQNYTYQKKNLHQKILLTSALILVFIHILRK
tara:strand:- start:726 stop:1487 length:762 start_codon:yes stop_codon:yes gene_type:complete